jgi:hypothetical protein
MKLKWIVIITNRSIKDHFGPFETYTDALDFYKKMPEENWDMKFLKSIWHLKDATELMSKPNTLEIENV